MIDGNDDKNKSNSGPLDPTKNAGDFFGDTRGRTGVTITSDEVDANEAEKNTLTGMSDAKAEAAENIASEIDDKTPDEDNRTIPTGMSQETEINQGEQSISGTTPDPEADDDTLENAHAMGEQLGEDEEHPQELDIGSDIDKAEEDIKTH